MLSSIWNQITTAEEPPAEDESFPATSAPPKHIDEDDIVASQLLSTFPPFGVNRPNMTRGGDMLQPNDIIQPENLLESPSSCSSSSSITSSEWENFSPRKNRQSNRPNGTSTATGGGGRRKVSNLTSSSANVNSQNRNANVEGDDESVDLEGYMMHMRSDEEDSVSANTATAGRDNNVQPSNNQTGNYGNKIEDEKDNGVWNDEEMSVWYDHEKMKLHRHAKNKDTIGNTNTGQRRKKKQDGNATNHLEEMSMYWNPEFRYRWIHAKDNATPAQLQQQQQIPQQQSNTYKVSEELKSLSNLGLNPTSTPVNKKLLASVKIGRNFTFDFDEEALTESSYSNDSYDDDDEGSVTEGKSSRSSNHKHVSTKNHNDKLKIEQNHINKGQQQQSQMKMIKHYNEKSHWMPDQLCKHCYLCEEKFTVFRRRHHCRLCGQVFCNRCSSYFVEIVDDEDGPPAPLEENVNENNENNGTSSGGSVEHLRTIPVRTCKMCYDQVSFSGPNGMLLYGGQKSEKEDPSSNNISNTAKDRIQNNTSSSTGENYGHKSLGDNVKSSQSQSIAQQLSEFQGGSSGKSDFFNLALVKEKLDMDRVKHEEEAKVAAEKEATEKAEKEEENPMGLFTKTISSTFSRRFGRLAESAAREAQIGDAGYDDEESKLIGTGVRNSEDEIKTDGNQTGHQDGVNNIACPPSFDHEPNDGTEGKVYVDEEKIIKEANRRMGLAAADHLEKLAKELLRLDAPLLLREKNMVGGNEGKEFERWINKLMLLATRCCSSVIPDVRNGDSLDIRPYCKIKVIPGGTLGDSVCISGIVFHKNVSHKTMAKEIANPRIMLLSGGIEYTRTENRIASLETLLEQESRYLQILVTKITKMKPDILMVGRSVSRKAQELLLGTGIVLLQHVKPSLMERIARQTGATILSSTDHVMNQFGTSVLGKCRRFRLVTFRDDDIFNQRNDSESNLLRQKKRNDAEKIQPFVENLKDRQSIDKLLATIKLSNHQRQALLAAGMLGEKVHDGSEAIKRGVSKRGVAITYVMMEGCPSHLGCTVVLRGASRSALKQVKRLFKFLLNVSYNLKLESSYLRSRRASLPPNYKLSQQPIMSSSLCVEYGSPPQGRKVRPWNGGGANALRSISGKITALDHQSILISSVWMAGSTQCCAAEVKGISYYSHQDVSLGQFLRDSCFNLTLKCQNPNCKKSVVDHSLSFIHNDGLINITVEKLDDPIPHPNGQNRKESSSNTEVNSDEVDELNNPIATWTYCLNCRKVVTPLSFLSDDTWKFSFGKFLEVFFYNKTIQLNSPEHQCSCTLQGASTLFFGCGDLAARFTYESIRPYGVYLRRHLSFDEDFHKKFTVLELNEIMITSTELFEKFQKQIEKIGSETRQLFGSPANRPEHLQTLLSQLNEMDKEVVRASCILKDKIVSVTNTYNAYNQGTVTPFSDSGRKEAQEAFAYFPWQSRRYIFMLTSAWNERLSAIGQALTAMKKLAEASQKVSVSGRGDIGAIQNPIAEGEIDDVKEAMKRLKQLKEYYSNMNVDEISIQPSQRRSEKRKNTDERYEIDDEEFNNNEAINDQDDLAINFSEEVDADVLASRQRYSKHGESNQHRKQPRKSTSDQRSKPPRRRSRGRSSSRGHPNRDSIHPTSSRSQSPSQLQNKSKSVTAGGAVKSALTRFFNRASKEHDHSIVDLGTISLGRPKIEPGVGGVVIPVIDDQPSTIIAHSLASADYASQFKRFAKSELKRSDGRRNRSDRDSTAVEDVFAGPGGMDSSPYSAKMASQSSRRISGERRSNSSQSLNTEGTDGKKSIERRMLVRHKTHIKHTFRDYDEKDSQIAKFVCTTFWATQFQAVRQAFLKESSNDFGQVASYNNSTFGNNVIEKNFVKSLSASLDWAVSGGKSGASFSKTSDERFIVKCISRTELQMFLDCAPAYFEYLSKAFFHGLPTMLCKIVGVYQIGYHNRVAGKRTMDQVAVMQNIFYGRNISRVFDLKGTLRGRFAKNLSKSTDKIDTPRSRDVRPKKRIVKSGSDSEYSTDDDGDDTSQPDSDDEEGVTYTVGQDDAISGESKPTAATLLDGDFLEFTGGRPLPLTDRAKAAFHMSILNDTLFLSIINVLDYSILVGIDEENNELVVGIIDFMRQYDILKQMERVGKSIPMVVGSEAPTIIQPPLYKARFINAMERYFMTVPSKWTSI